MGFFDSIAEWFGCAPKVKTKAITRDKSVAIVNGRRYEMHVSGGSLSIVNGNVYHNGVLIEDCNGRSEKEICVIVDGDAEKVNVDNGNVVVNGSAGSIETDCGNVEISGSVSGDVYSDCGNIKCGEVMGNVKTECGNVSPLFYRRGK